MEEVDHQIERLKSDIWWVRRDATETLGKIGAPAAPAIPALIEALKDSNLNVRWEAADALGNIGTPAIPALIEVLKDSNSGVRKGPAEALGNIARNQPTVHLRKAIPVLKRLRCTFSERELWDVYRRALETIENATAGLKDIPIPTTTAATRADGLPVPVEEAPTTAP